MLEVSVEQSGTQLILLIPGSMRADVVDFHRVIHQSIETPVPRLPGTSGEVTFEYCYFLTFSRVTRDHALDAC